MRTNIPLKKPIPLEYADVLGVHATMIAHVNAGRRHLKLEHVITILEKATDDTRLWGLTIYDLRPELEKVRHLL